MELKNSKIFNQETMQAVSAFCKSQEIDDIDNFIYLCFKQGFDIKKYGLLGDNSQNTSEVQEKWVEKVVIVEKQVEIPVEVVKEVEKIVEVPVEVIKEVPVEKVVTKIEYISDKTSENELLFKIQNLENEMSKKDNELDELRHNLDIILDELRPNSAAFRYTLDELRPNLVVFRYTLDELKKTSGENMVKDKSKLLQETIKQLKIELIEKENEIKDLQKVNQSNNKPVQPIRGNYLRGSNLI